MLVMKFGGTSVADASRFKDVLNIVREDRGRCNRSLPGVVVLSAMSGVTNGLIACAQEAQTGNSTGALEKLATLKVRHFQVVDELFSDTAGSASLAPTRMDILQNGVNNNRRVDDPLASKEQLCAVLEADFDKLSVLLQGIACLGELSKRSLDAVSSCGELLSSQMFAAYAQWQGFPARYFDARSFIVTSSDYGRAFPLMPEIISHCRAQILPVIQKGEWVITQGFVGATVDGVTTTLGRGGSDYSAALIGAAIDADEIQIWTDVDGMMTCDPRIVRDARPIAQVTFQEAAELAYFGAKVLHPLTIKPAVEKNIPVRILNTLNPKSSGTIIMATIDNIKPSGNGKISRMNEPICAIATKKGLAAVFINSPRMLMATGFLAEVFAVFARHETPIDLVATSEISVSLTVDRFDNLLAIEKELRQLGEVLIVRDLAIVSVVGRQLKEQTGITGQIFKALSAINIVMISFGASEINLNFVVANKDADQAIKLLHAEFFPALVAHCATGT